MPSLYNDPNAKRAIHNLYFDKLEALNIPYESLTIETSFGDTHILISGQKDGPPLVLLHGANGCAPVAMEAMIGLEKKFRIFAIDVIGQPNLSAETRPDMRSLTYGQWFQEILSRLHISNVTLVGISFGGFVSWKTLIFDERRISRAFLIVPAGIVNGNPLRALLRVFWPMKRYIKSKNPKFVHQFLGALFTGRDPFAIQFLSLVFAHFSMDFSPIPSIRKAEAEQIETPVYVAGAENDLLFPGNKLIRRARRIFGNLQGSFFLEGSKHVPNAADNKRLVDWIIENSSIGSGK